MKKYLEYLKIMWRAISDFIPVFLFAFSYEISRDFYLATFALIISTISLTLYTFSRHKRLPYIAIFICLETSVFGFLTIHHHNPHFIQIRDTIFDSFMGIVILVTAFMGRPILKKFLDHAFVLENHDWINISFAWGLILLTFANINEYVRMNFSEDIWVRYKFSVMLVTILFSGLTMFIFRGKIKKMLGE